MAKYNVSFTSLRQAMEVNKLDEAAAVALLRKVMTNDNYRSEYNSAKNKLQAAIKNHPEVKKIAEALKKKVG